MEELAAYAFIVRKLPDALRGLEPAAAYPVEVAPALKQLAKAVDEERA